MKPTTRVPDRQTTNLRSLENLFFNLATVLLICGLGYFGALELGFGEIWAIGLIPAVVFTIWAWPRCWYITEGNSVTLTEDIFSPAHTLDRRAGDSRNRGTDRQITCYIKYGPGFAIARWTERFYALIETELVDPINLQYTITFQNDSGKVKVTVRYRPDYRRLDWFVALGKTQAARENAVAEIVDEEVGSLLESILTQHPVEVAIRNEKRDGKRKGFITIEIEEEFLGDEVSDMEWDNGIQISGITFTVNMSEIREKQFSARGAADDARKAAEANLALAERYAELGGWKAVNESLSLQSALSGNVKGFLVISSGNSGGTPMAFLNNLTGS